MDSAEINSHSLLMLFVACLCCIGREYRHYAFDDAPKETTKSDTSMDETSSGSNS